MNETCGVFILNERDEVLICHPTGASWKQWSIPKGLREPDESHEEAAIRETREETGLEVKNLIFIGQVAYTRQRKVLYGYLCLDRVCLNKDLICVSMVERPKEGLVPEIDRYRWVAQDRVAEYIHDTQAKLWQTILKEFF